MRFANVKTLCIRNLHTTRKNLHLLADKSSAHDKKIYSMHGRAINAPKHGETPRHGGMAFHKEAVAEGQKHRKPQRNMAPV